MSDQDHWPASDPNGYVASPDQLAGWVADKLTPYVRQLRAESAKTAELQVDEDRAFGFQLTGAQAMGAAYNHLLWMLADFGNRLGDSLEGAGEGLAQVAKEYSGREQNVHDLIDRTGY